MFQRIVCMMTLLPRKSGKFITSLCNDVSINDKKVVETAAVLSESFKSKQFSLANWKNHPLHPKVADEKTINIIFVIDVLNFSFWPKIPGKKFGIKYVNKLNTGYWSLVAALKRADDAGIPVYDAEFMSKITEEEFGEIFRSDTKVEVPLLQERLEGYRENGQILLEKFGGNFANCVRQSNRDAVSLMKIIVENFPSFRDESTFADQKVSFYKRAQILVADIWCCFEREGLGSFTNIEEITMFADYRVPQSLEYFGILEYSSALKKVLENRTELSPGDRYELEIRGASIEAVERLVCEVRLLLTNEGLDKSKISTVNSITVDNFLWDYAQDHREKIDHLAFHLVRTIYY